MIRLADGRIRILVRAVIYGLVGVAAFDAAAAMVAGLIIWEADYFQYMVEISPIAARFAAFQWAVATALAWPYAKRTGL